MKETIDKYKIASRELHNAMREIFKNFTDEEIRNFYGDYPIKKCINDARHPFEVSTTPLYEHTIKVITEVYASKVEKELREAIETIGYDIIEYQIQMLY